MDLEQLKEFANTIKHCGDYGGLWIYEDHNHIVWVAGDADFDPDEVESGICSSWDYIIHGFKSLGIQNVDIEAEWRPDETGGWTFLGRLGIDNYWESKAFWERHYDDKRLEEIHEKQIPLEELSERDKKLLFDDIDHSMRDANQDIEQYAGIKSMSDL